MVLIKGGMDRGREGRVKWGVAGCKMVISEMSLDKYGDIGRWGTQGVGHKGRGVKGDDGGR